MSLYDDYINSVSKKYFVDFLARRGVPGHAFVNVRVSLSADLEIALAAFGIYPDSGKKLSGIKSIISPTDGELKYTFDDLDWSTRFTVEASDEQAKTILKKLNEWKQETPKYSLFADGGLNCNALVAAVAKELGLRIPNGAGSTLPWFFIDELRVLQEVNK
jgi:hypothetical protein